MPNLYCSPVPNFFCWPFGAQLATNLRIAIGRNRPQDRTEKLNTCIYSGHRFEGRIPSILHLRVIPSEIVQRHPAHSRIHPSTPHTSVGIDRRGCSLPHPRRVAQRALHQPSHVRWATRWLCSRRSRSMFFRLAKIASGRSICRNARYLHSPHLPAIHSK